MNNVTDSTSKNSERSDTIPEKLLNSLSAVVGKENILIGEDAEAIYTDVYRHLEIPSLVIRPKSIEQLQIVVVEVSKLKLPISIRGGGASYTDGYSSNKKGFVLLDLRLLSRIVEINEQDGFVTVEAGTTWAELKKQLDLRGLRTPFWGPFSGLKATVGGSMSQNTISHGSGKHGISAQSAISMDVVLSNGEMLSTGSASTGAKPFLRYFGPDLTGLFTGDCGSLGIKARITLPLLKKLKAHRTISFSFADFAAMHESMRRISQEQLEDTHFALDGALSQGQIARQENAGQIIKIAWAILNSSPSYWEGVKQLIKSASSAKKAITSSPYMTHYIVEGINDAEVKARLSRLREINTDLGHEIPATVPSIVRGMPFAEFFNTLGPNGERWVPLHGILSHSKVPAFHKALEALYQANKEKMDSLGIWNGGMFGAVGPSGFLYEIALYWPDEITAYHKSVIPEDYLSKLPSYPANLAARQFVDQLKKDITALFVEHDAVNFQIGKAYPYLNRLSSPAQRLVKGIKSCLDPDNQSSTNSLGFD